MNRKIKEFMHSKVFVTISILFFILAVIITGTYAWFTWSSTENTNLTMVIGKLAEVAFTSGNDITTGLTPVFNYYDGEKTTFSVNNRSTTGETIFYTIKLNITTIPTELRRTDVKYTLVKNSVVVASGNLGDATDGSSINIYSTELETGITSYEFYLYIDGNEENPTTMQNKTIVGNIMVEQSEGTLLVSKITDLYNSVETKDTVTNNGIDYHYATSVSLMNDRLGGTTTDLDGGNIRYYGANPDNYIDIGDTELDDDGKEVKTLYRIIGLFKDVIDETGNSKDLIKVIRSDEIEDYSWDTSSSTVNSGYGINEWSQADLMKLLNPGYDSNTDLNSDGSSIIVNNSLYWNSESGYCYMGSQNDSGNCDFTDKGLNSSARSKIASVVWNLGGHNSSDVYPNQIYNYERGTTVISDTNDAVTRTTFWTGKIALMYPSDYGYATDLNSCIDTIISEYTLGECSNNDWLANSSIDRWLLTPSTENESMVWTSDAISFPGELPHMIYEPILSSPTFYLNSDLVIVSGKGTESSPYVVQ